MLESPRQEFTYDYYAEFVSRLREVYQFVTFSEGKRNQGTDSPLLIMRHDIDMDLEAALRLSLLEKELGIHSTYFFLIRCPLYNVFDGTAAEQVKQILDTGHHFGLHFDCALYQDITVDKLNTYILKECELLERFFQCPVDAVSFHRPGRLELSGVELERLPNSYERVFLEGFEYFSDSRGNWARGNPLNSEAFKKKKNLHIAIHPIWWTAIPMTPYESLVELVQRIVHRSEQYISENCQVWNKARQSGAIADS
ncbi:MAG: hypothetical protein WBE46_08360 [Dehalococcoidia bacterium]